MAGALRQQSQAHQEQRSRERQRLFAVACLAASKHGNSLFKVMPLSYSQQRAPLALHRAAAAIAEDDGRDVRDPEFDHQALLRRVLVHLALQQGWQARFSTVDRASNVFRCALERRAIAAASFFASHPLGSIQTLSTRSPATGKSTACPRGSPAGR